VNEATDNRKPESAVTGEAKGCSLDPLVRPTDTERLNWLLKNRAPGPVCWYRDGNGEEWLLNSREAVDKKMNQ
jgi:hypothetical protein